MEDTEVTEPQGMGNTLYQKLAAPFDKTFSDNRGGVDLKYITGEQCITRLNEILGFENWSFKVIEHGIHVEADECWVLGELTAYVPAHEANHWETRTLVRQQFGSNKVKRSRSSGTPLDIGFDLKGAATDAQKKCAMAIGVALYLSERNVQVQQGGGYAQPQSGNNGYSAPPANNGGGFTPSQASQGGDSGGALTCEDCGEYLTPTNFKDGSIWSPEQLASYGRRKHGRILNMDCYRKANTAKRNAEESLQQIPF